MASCGSAVEADRRNRDRWRDVAWSHSGLLAVGIAYLVVAIAYSLIVPLGETPDEPAHFDFVRFVAARQALPVQRMVQDNEVAEGHQAPLYYILAALPLSFSGTAHATVPHRPNGSLSFAIDGAPNKHALLHTIGEGWPFTGYVLGWHTVRLFSVACGLVAVLAAYAFAGVVFRGDRALMLASASLVGLNPQFAFVSGAASNDSLTAALGATMLLLAVLAIDQRRPSLWRYAVFGAVAGLAIITKLTLAAPVAVAYLVLAWSISRNGGDWIRRLGVSLMATTAVAGWWFVRNASVYGDAFALNVDRAQNPSLVWDQGRLSLRLALDVFSAARLSYVARFGWMNVAPPRAVDDVVMWMSVTAAAGLVILTVRGVAGRPVAGRIALLGVSSLFAAVMFGTQVFAAAIKGASAFQGRYMFAVSAAVAVLVVAGLGQLAGTHGRWPLAVGTLFGGTLLSIYCLFGVIVPTYPTPLPIVRDDLHGQPRVLLDAGVGSTLRLLGLDTDESTAEGGRHLDVRLAWHALQRPEEDFTAFVHVVSAQSGKLAAQSDHVPLAPLAPPTTWMPGDTAFDSHRIDLAELPSGEYVLHVGMYNLRDLKRLPVFTVSGEVSDHLEIPLRLE